MASITSEQMNVLLFRLKNNLEIITDYMDAEAQKQKEQQLYYYIQSAMEFIEREGITLDLDSISDGELVVMYASWLYDKRKDGVAVMPRMLRYNLNNRVFAEKVNSNV